MADVPFSTLTAASALTGTEVIPVTQGGNSRRTTTAAIVQSPTLLTAAGGSAGRTLANRFGDLQLLSIAALGVLNGTAMPSSEPFFVQGYYAAGDGGGGWFYYNAASSATANGGTIIAPADGVGRFLRVYDGAIWAKWFGAYGDDTHDDRAAIVAALAAITASGVRNTLILANGTFKLSAGIVFDQKYHSILGYRAVLDAASMSTGAVITCKSTQAGNPYLQGDASIKGIEIIGPGSGSTVDGIVYNDATSGASHLLVENVNIHACRYATNFGNNSYAITHVQCGMYGSSRGIWSGPSLTNAGERLTFIGCDIYNNAIGIKQDFGSGEMMLNNCSVDYNVKQFEITTGLIICTDCHIEFDPSGVTGAMATVDTSGQTGLLRICGGRIVLKAVSAAGGFTAFFDTDNLTGGITLDGTFLDANPTSLPASLKTGVGRFFWQNYSGTPSGNINLFGVTTAGENLLQDPGFESASFPNDLINVDLDSVAITNRLQTAVGSANCILSQSATQAHSGSKSLKMVKAGSGGSFCKFSIIVPVRNKARLFGSIWYIKPGAGSGSFIIEVGYLNMLAMGKLITDPLAYSEIDTGSATITITGTTAIPWTQQVLSLPPAPAWATHGYIAINAFSFVGPDSIYFDDIVLAEA